MKMVACLRPLVLVLGIAVAVSGCERQGSIVRNLADLERDQYPGGTVPTERIEELEALVEERREEVSSALQAAARTATALRHLALEYARMQFYGPALDAFEEAVRIEPRNAGLLFWAGAMSAQLAKAQGAASERDRYLQMAQRYYSRSVEIEPRHTESLYGLGVLYHFEMERHVAALEIAQQLVEVEPKHIQGLFLLARIQTTLGDIDDAVATYERILENASDQESKEQARRNVALLTGGES
jgi:tetratricopeptide (TPR) repeat protein